MKKIILLASFILFISCGTRQSYVMSKYEEKTFPELNKLHEVEIGETLITNYHANTYDAIRVTKEYKSAKFYFGGGIKKEIYVLRSRMDGYDLYFHETSNVGVAIATNGGADKGFVKNSSTSISLFNLKENIEYEKTTYNELDNNYYKQEFIYNGKVGNGIKFVYREFANNQAQNAYKQELQYDLSESNIIGFKGLRIEVITATNTQIDYRILKNFKK